MARSVRTQNFYLHIYLHNYKKLHNFALLISVSIYKLTYNYGRLQIIRSCKHT